MLRQKRLAIARRQREAELHLVQNVAAEKRLRKQKREDTKRRKELKKWRLFEFKRKYSEAFACEPHRSQPTWAEGPTTKPRSVLDNY